jgi:hypothetical protein
MYFLEVIMENSVVSCRMSLCDMKYPDVNSEQRTTLQYKIKRKEMKS